MASIRLNLRVYSRVFFRQLFVEITFLILEQIVRSVERLHQWKQQAEAQSSCRAFTASAFVSGFRTLIVPPVLSTRIRSEFRMKFL